MKEVSNKVFAMFVKDLRRRAIDPAVLLDNTDVTLPALMDKNERVDWAVHNRIMANVRRHFSDEELVQVGRSWLRSPGLRFVFVVGRLLLTPMGFYRWMNKPREGAGNQMFTCVTPKHRDLTEDTCEVELTLPEGFEVCWEFYIVTKGNFIEMPRLLGYPSAKVELTRIPRGGRFHITVPRRARLFTRIRRALFWPFTVRAAARELQSAHETLQDRVLELEGAREQLARQASQLATANRIANLALGPLPPDEVLRSVCAALVEDAGCRHAALVLDDSEPLDAERRPAPTELSHFPLMSSDTALGSLEVELVTPGPDAIARIERLLPTVVLAVQKALDQRALAAYHQGLEQRVEERTIELTRARDELAATVQHLEETKQSRERLFHNISHEIRTPLSLVLLLVDGVLTHHRGELTERAVAQMNSITASTRKLVRLVDELLLLASGQERDLTVQPEPVALAQFLPELVAGWHLAAREAGLTFTLDAAHAGVALVDPSALERVVANLLSNAIKFTPHGGTVAMTARADGDVVRFTVTDDGPGIDDALRARLFGRFEQGDAGKRLRAGSGIGLSIARELVRAHGGDLTERSAPGSRGARFEFTVPSTVVVPQHSPSSRLRPSDYGVGTTAPTFTSQPPGLSHGTVLVAEDDPGLAAAIAEHQSDEYTVIVAHDGASALAAATRMLPDLLVTDIEMPGIDGLELARQVRSIPGEIATPVLIMSARARLGDRLAGFETGAIDYLIKPFDPAELKARVQAQLAFRAVTQRAYRAEKLAAMGTLSAGLAHELRNPANGIVNAIAPLRELLPPEALDPTTGVGDLIDVMEQCAEQVAYVSRQLLGFRRSGDLELRRMPIADVISRALANAGAALGEVTVKSELAFTGTIRCAAPLLTQVLVNLLENAAQAAGPGGWVTIGTTNENEDRVCIEVSDSGPGVPLALQERIFEPFFTTKPPGQGTGLGLSTARDLVQRHGGTLELRSRDARTVFVIDLPLSPEVRR